MPSLLETLVGAYMKDTGSSPAQAIGDVNTRMYNFNEFVASNPSRPEVEEVMNGYAKQWAMYQDMNQALIKAGEPNPPQYPVQLRDHQLGELAKILRSR